MSGDIQEMARNVVERARAGDQVAMGLIVGVRENAAKGDPRAIASRKAILSYIDKHPVSSMGAEAPYDLVMGTKALHCLWKVPAAGFDEMFVKASPFVTVWQAVMAVVHRGNLTSGAPLVTVTNVEGSRLASIVREACGIRRLRNRNVPLSAYSPIIGWEHGE